MRKSSGLVAAVYRVVRLRFKDPRICRCMLASLLFAVATTGLLAKAQNSCPLMDPSMCGKTIITFVHGIIAK